MRRGHPGRLSPLKLRQVAKKIGYHADGGNLYLSVTDGPNGPRASWVCQYIRDGKKHQMGLGSLTIVTLAMARERAMAARRQLLDNIDPLAAKRQQKQHALVAAGKAVTFADCVQKYYDAHSPKWGAAYRRAWPATMKRHILSTALGGMPVAAVDKAAVIAALEPIWSTQPNTASRLRAWIEAVLDFAEVSGWREGANPARWKLLSKRFASVRQLRPVEHMRAMKWQDVPAFIRELRQKTELAAAALEFAILTWSRPSESREAQWDEIDFEAATWTVPPGRMKGKREHRVPLSDTAVAVLRRMAEIRQNEFVFPGQHGPVSKDAVRKLMIRMGRGDYTRHGFRSAAADWRAESTQFDAELQEACLAHALPNGTQAAYQRGTQFAKRRKVMDAWAAFLDGAEARPSHLRAVS